MYYSILPLESQSRGLSYWSFRRVKLENIEPDGQAKADILSSFAYGRLVKPVRNNSAEHVSVRLSLTFCLTFDLPCFTLNALFDGRFK